MRIVRSALLLAALTPVGAQQPPPPPIRTVPPTVATPRTPRAPLEWELGATTLDREFLSGRLGGLSVLDRTWSLAEELPPLGEHVWQRFTLPTPRTPFPPEFSLLEPPLAGLRGLAPSPRAAWASGDPADSLYRDARELLNRGEWRRAVALFKELQVKYPGSAYAPDALYWQAFALYRIGGTEDLRAASAVLESQRTRYPGAKTQSDAVALGTRIRGALAARGDATAARELRGTTADSALRCDGEEQSVRAEALSAVAQSDPEGILPMLQRVLQRKDECSVVLRRAAVFLVGSKRRDAPAITLLTQVARNDPSFDVREAAIGWLARTSSDDAVAVLEEIVRDGSDERMQRAAARALVGQPSARARVAVRALVERNDVPERIRLDAIGAFERESTTPEDAAWLRSVFAKSTDNQRMRSRIVGVISRLGGTENDQWLLTVARNPEEDSETRGYALQKVALTLPIADLAKLYDVSAERRLREALIDVLTRRTEPEATDKLIDILKTGTDPNLRRQAISGLTRKKDARSTRLLMEIIEK